MVEHMILILVNVSVLQSILESSVKVSLAQTLVCAGLAVRLKSFNIIILCLLVVFCVYVAHKTTTNKEQRLRCNKRPSLLTKYWNTLPGELLE